jgi:hypothetical protein
VGPRVHRFYFFVLRRSLRLRRKSTAEKHTVFFFRRRDFNGTGRVARVSPTRAVSTPNQETLMKKMAKNKLSLHKETVRQITLSEQFLEKVAGGDDLSHPTCIAWTCGTATKAFSFCRPCPLSE